MNKENKMRQLRIAKVTLNMGIGEAGEKLLKAKKLLEVITGTKSVITKSNKRIPAWNVRPGLELGVKCTLRGAKAIAVLERMLKAKEDVIKARNFDNKGNLAFGVKEYIDIPSVEYDPTVGIVGLDVCVTIERPGYRVKIRKIRPGKIAKGHIVTKEEAMEFIKNKFNVKIETKKAEGENK